MCEGRSGGQEGGKLGWGAWKGGKNGTLITQGDASTDARSLENRENA